MPMFRIFKKALRHLATSCDPDHEVVQMTVPDAQDVSDDLSSSSPGVQDSGGELKLSFARSSQHSCGPQQRILSHRRLVQSAPLSRRQSSPAPDFRKSKHDCILRSQPISRTTALPRPNVNVAASALMP